MRLISLELHGFKSFADRTKITFDRGMTVIVGPNGSGKSNISDAIKWVLGEVSAKNIRGQKLEDIIFGGTERRSPMGFAEVSITIDNTGELRIDSEYDIITVTRRYFKNGDSQYFINQKQTRLKDIVDLFMNTGIGKTGYSIVGQGRIGEIISQKSEERRYIFEEAAGISKYRMKKNESERKLVEINSNLDRVNDVLSLLEARVGPLAEDAEKARVYLEVYEKKKACDVALILFDIDSLAKQNEEFERSYVIAKNNLDIAEDSLLSINKRSDTILSETESAKNKIEEKRASLGSAVEKRHLLESSILVYKSNIEHAEKEIDRLKSEISSLESELILSYNEDQKSKDEVSMLECKLDTERVSLKTAENALSDAVTTHNSLVKEYNQALSDKAACEKQHVEKRIRLSALASTKTSLEERLASVRASLEDAKKAAIKTLDSVKSSEKKIGEFKQKSESISFEKAAVTEKCDEIGKKKNALINELNNTNAQIAAKQRQIEVLKRMEEHFEGYQKSVKFVVDAQNSGKLSGICGPVSRLINVEPHYITAIECALGANLQNLVVENEAAAKNAMYLLKRENAGRATFYPITSVHPDLRKMQPKQYKGFIGVASSLVSCDTKYSDIIEYLLGKVHVFDNIDNAETAAKSTNYNMRCVTLNGQMINVGGSFTGGSVRRDSGMLTRSYEIASLANEVEKLKSSIEGIKAKIDICEKDLFGNQNILDDINQKVMVLTSLLKAEQTTLSLLNSQLEAQNGQITVIKDSENHIISQQNASVQLEYAIEAEIVRLETSITSFDLKLTTISNDIVVAEQDEKAAANEKNSRMMTVFSCENSVQNAKIMLDKQLDTTNGIKARLESAKSELNAVQTSLTTINESIKNTDNEMISQNTETNEINKEIKALGEYIAALEKEDGTLRAKLRDKSAERDIYFQEFTRLDLKRVTLGSEREKLTSRLWDEYELTYASASELDYPPVAEKTRGHFVYELGKHRSKIRELGNVNVGAIEEYAKVKSDFDFYTTQVNDLNASKNKYASVIANMEREMCQRFNDTFTQINENFKVAFKDLFRGGNANLKLTDPDNVLVSGIDIEVAPPGKVINNLKALSGGEQVFVAIAILFAIFKVNPPPFCLLDEIESALDEVNVVRFAQYAQKFCDKSQFIIISHRRGTMEEANSLYGVTMQERGITSILSVNVAEVESKIGLKTNET